jgi:hypothetical protein
MNVELKNEFRLEISSFLFKVWEVRES